jgi:hypothetical protein
LELLDKVDAFRGVFDFAEFEKVRDHYIVHILVSAENNPMAGEIRTLMQRVGFNPTFRNRLVAIITYPVFWLAAKSPIYPSIFGRLYNQIIGFPTNH